MLLMFSRLNYISDVPCRIVTRSSQIPPSSFKYEEDSQSDFNPIFFEIKTTEPVFSSRASLKHVLVGSTSIQNRCLPLLSTYTIDPINLWLIRIFDSHQSFLWYRTFLLLLLVESKDSELGANRYSLDYNPTVGVLLSESSKTVNVRGPAYSARVLVHSTCPGALTDGW